MENALELEAAAAIGNGSDGHETSGSVEVRPELLLDVAGALKDMVGTLVSDIKANSQVQELMPVIQKASVATHHACFQDFMKIPKHQQFPSYEETLVCTSSRHSREAKRAAAGRDQSVVCRHSCEHHQEVVDPWLWRNSSQELWSSSFQNSLCFISSINTSFSALRRCHSSPLSAERSPKDTLNSLGFLRGSNHTRTFISLSTTLNPWSGSATLIWVVFKIIVESLMRIKTRCTCDGGLVCSVLDEHSASSPIFSLQSIGQYLENSAYLLTNLKRSSWCSL